MLATAPDMDMDTNTNYEPHPVTQTLTYTHTLSFRQSQLPGYLQAAAGVFCFNKQFLICNYSSCSCSALELFLMRVRMQTYYAYEACSTHTHICRATCLLRRVVDCRQRHKTPIKVSNCTARNGM